MSIWDQRVLDHQVFTSLKSLREALVRARTRAENESDLESVERLRTAEAFISRSLSQADPSLISVGTLNGLDTPIRQTLGEVTHYVGNGVVGHLANANNHMDNALPQARLVPTIQTPPDVERVQEAVVRFRRSAGQHLSRIEKRVSGLVARIDTAEKSLSEQETRVQSEKARLDAAIQQFIQQSTEAQQKQSGQFSDVLADAKSEVAGIVASSKDIVQAELASAEEAFNDKLRALTTSAASIVSDLQSQQAKAHEIVGIIASTGMAGGYERTAESERKQADRWRWIAFAGILGIIGFAVYALVSTIHEGFETESFIAKAFVSLTFALLAAYAGREAEKHRVREQRNRRLQLELSSIDAYLDSLPEKERNAIKAAVADRIFGHLEVASSDIAPNTSSQPSLLEFLKIVGINKA